MNEEGRKTYGFGRVSSRFAPSPYSPLHAPSQWAGDRPSAPAAARPRRSRLGRIVAVVVVIALAGVAVGVLWYARPAAAPAASRTEAPAVRALEDPPKHPAMAGGRFQRQGG